MYIYLPEVRLKSGEAVDYSFEEKLSDCFDDFKDSGSLILLISASSIGDKVVVTGSLEVSTLTICSRCLEQFEHSFITDFKEAFTVLKTAPFEDTPDFLAAEAANMLTVSGDYLYIDEYIRQLIILAQEYSPLCKPECRGICAGCGADLNKADCLCGKDDNLIDTRLLKLKELNSGS
jgi:uncharacterized protein